MTFRRLVTFHVDHCIVSAMGVLIGTGCVTVRWSVEWGSIAYVSVCNADSSVDSKVLAGFLVSLGIATLYVADS